jgi:AAA domain
MNTHDIKVIADRIVGECIHHSLFDSTVTDIVNQLFVLEPGEIIILVGPSRVGKSRAVIEAMRQVYGPLCDDEDHRPYVRITNENAQSAGEFSTRGFMLSACEAINHPIYGMRNDASPQLMAHIHRTPEAIFRDAFEKALVTRGIKVVVIDEAHHVGYAKGGIKTATKILDSWKCLAAKTNTILVLCGAYELLNLCSNTPHLVGRQRPIEFPRYKSSSRDDIYAFESVLEAFSRHVPFENKSTTLRTWNRLLFEGSLGCTGHLSLWLRTAVARMAGRGQTYLSESILQKYAFKAIEYKKLWEEIDRGEQLMAGLLNGVATKSTSDVAKHTVLQRKSKPFVAKTSRRPRGGRV